MLWREKRRTVLVIAIGISLMIMLFVILKFKGHTPPEYNGVLVRDDCYIINSGCVL